LQEFTLWLLLGQRQSSLIRGPSLGRAEPAAQIGSMRRDSTGLSDFQFYPMAAALAPG
jgi:hypothetical protein